MKALVTFLFPTIKAVIAVCSFMIGIGWAAFGTVSFMVKAQADEIRKEVMTLDKKNMDHINKRFDDTQSMIKALIEKGK